jgi:hypothetical protein
MMPGPRLTMRERASGRPPTGRAIAFGVEAGGVL